MGLDVDDLRLSFELVIEREPNLTGRFYEVLFERHPEARALFARNDPEDQARMLGEALAAVLDHIEEAAWLRDTLGPLGRRHVEYGVTAEMYGWVRDALLATLAQVAGEDWSPALHVSWSDAIGAVSALMLDGASAARVGKTG